MAALRDVLKRSGLTVGAFVLYGGLVILIAIFAAQETRYAFLPPSMTRRLWASTLVTIAGALVLRSGWWRDNDWRREQLAIGTLANNFYEPRREVLTQGFAVAGGVFIALWWGASTWILVLSGIRRDAPGRGLLNFEVAVLVGAISGAMVGAVVGLASGEVWERRHRRRRRALRTDR